MATPQPTSVLQPRKTIERIIDEEMERLGRLEDELDSTIHIYRQRLQKQKSFFSIMFSDNSYYTNKIKELKLDIRTQKNYIAALIALDERPRGVGKFK